MLDNLPPTPLLTTTTFAGITGGRGGGSGLILKRADPVPAPAQVTRAVAEPPFAVRGTLHRHETAPFAAFFFASFAADAPGRVIVVPQIFPAGRTPAVTKRLLPAVTFEGATRTRTAVLLAAALDTMRKESPIAPSLRLRPIGG